MSNEKLELQWKNCTSCQFPTECRREELPERGCVAARTIWFCAICAHSDLGEMVRNPLRHFAEDGTSPAIRQHLAYQRRDAAWQTNLLAGIAIATPRLWQMLEERQGIVDATALNESLDAELAEIKAAQKVQGREQ